MAISKKIEREEAFKLRKEGYSINDISKSVGVSKSTVSYWCRDIKLSRKALGIIAEKSAKKSTEYLLKYSEMLRQQRLTDEIHITHEAAKIIRHFSERDLLMVGLGLYWGEGYKKGSREFGFTNSDPQMIILYLKWLESVFGVKAKDLVFRVSINQAHRHRLNDVLNFWMNLCRVPSSQFTKTSLIKTENQKIYTNQSVHMGTLRVKVKNGARLRKIVLAMIENINSQ